MTQRDALHTPGLVVSAADARWAQQGMFLPAAAATPAIPKPGVLPGGGNPYMIVPTSPISVAVKIQTGQILTVRNSQGYLGSNDADYTLALSAVPGSGSRYDVIYVKQNDAVDQGDANSVATIDRVTGTAAATPSLATVQAAVPAGALMIGHVQVFSSDSGGIAATRITNYFPRTGLRGGILPVIDPGSISGGDAGVFDGQYRDHPTQGLQRWSANLNRWDPATGGAVSVFPSGDQTISPGATFGYEALRLTAAYAGERFTCVAQANTLCNTANVQQTVQLTRNTGNPGSNWTLGQSMFEYVERYPGGAGADWRMLTRMFDFTANAAGLVIVNLMVGVGTGGSTVTTQGMRCWAINTGLLT